MDVQLRKWTRVEYERLVEAEIRGPDDRVELLGGAMICKEPQHSPHATAVGLVQRVLYRDAHPTRPVLVVEVALSRLGFDRDRKGSLYARAGLADYWIVNLPDRRLEVYRGPVSDGAAPFSWRYGTALALGPDDRVAPLAAPTATITVADLLP